MAELILFNKPRNVVVSTDDPDHKTVYALLPAWFLTDGWQAVGRLDRESRGALLFTQNGYWIECLTRPGGCTKTYRVEVRGHVDDTHLRQLECGIASPVGRLSARRVTLLKQRGPRSLLEVELDEGKNRQIRRMFQALKDPRHGTSLKVMQLTRIAIGGLTLGDLALGAWRKLQAAELPLLGLD